MWSSRKASPSSSIAFEGLACRIRRSYGLAASSWPYLTCSWWSLQAMTSTPRHRTNQLHNRMEGASQANRPSLALLILPDPPSEVSTSTFRAAYEPALVKALCRVSSTSNAEFTARLDIALICSDALPARSERPRDSIYLHAQHIIGLLYRLVCSICIEKKIDVLFDNDVDVRAVLIGNDGGLSSEENRKGHGSLQGPVIDLVTLGSSPRPWRHVFSIESEEGEGTVRSFLRIRLDHPLGLRQPTNFTRERLTGGTIVKRLDKQESQSVDQDSTNIFHYSVAVGGTFDHLHAGHKLLLTATALLLEPASNSKPQEERCLTIGITGDELLKNKRYAEVLESWDERQAAVCQFLLAIIHFGDPEEGIEESVQHREEGPNGRAIHYRLKGGLLIKCVEISDPYGPTITDESITALVVSGETRSGGKAVNEKRAEKGWSELAVFEIDVLDAESQDETEPNRTNNFQGKISSTEIRKRLLERDSGLCWDLAPQQVL